MQVLPLLSLFVPSGHTVLDHVTPVNMAWLKSEPERLEFTKCTFINLEPTIID
jgi:hypothetical protein